MYYDEIVKTALHAVIADLRSGRLHLEIEGDLRGFLFHRCVEILSRPCDPPLPIHAEKPVGSVQRGTRRPRADLVIGPKAETVVELKFEPYNNVQGRVDPKAVGRDIRKLRAWARGGHSGHFIMIELEGEDTEGEWYFPRQKATRIPKEEWHTEEEHFVWVHYKVPPRS